MLSEYEFNACMHACMRQALACVSEWNTAKALHCVSFAMKFHIQQHMHPTLMCPFALACILTMQPCFAINAACHLTLQIRVAEFQSETVKCTVSGSGFPGLARQHQLAGLTAGFGGTLPEEALLWGKAETGRLPKGIITTGKGGAGTPLCNSVTFAPLPSLSPNVCHHSCLSCLDIGRSHESYPRISI